MPFAETTKVPVAQTKAEIERLIEKRKGSAFGILQQGDAAMVVFGLQERHIRFTLHFPADATDQRKRSLWRALLLVIKAKLEAVDAGIETLEEAFLAQVVMPDGQTVAEHTLPRIAESYRDRSSVPLLPAPKREEKSDA